MRMELIGDVGVDQDTWVDRRAASGLRGETRTPTIPQHVQTLCKAMEEMIDSKHHLTRVGNTK